MSHVECLTHLDFLPTLTATPVLLPPSLSLVISNSLTKHTLADSSTSGYNHRVAEVTLAAVLLNNAWGEHRDAGERLTLRDVVLQAGFASGNEEDDVRCAVGKLGEVLGPASQGWSGKQILERCLKARADCPAPSFPALPCGESSSSPRVPVPSMKRKLTCIDRPQFHLRKRAQHTYDEVLRLAEFVRICRSLQEASPRDGSASEVEEDCQVRQLGRLISATHESLRDLYEATVPSVDELQRLCLQHGALGSRQMGESCLRLLK